MKSKGKIWILFDLKTRKQSKPLSTTQAQMMLLEVQGKDAKRFLLWTPGWTEWLPLEKFLASDQTFFVFAPAPLPGTTGPNLDEAPTLTGDEKTVTAVLRPELDEDSRYTQVFSGDKPKQKAGSGYWDAEFSAEKIDPDAAPLKMQPPGIRPTDRRQDERHHFKIEAILINKQGRAFRTNSLNISLGGTLLEDDLPREFLNTRFDLILVNRFEKDPIRGRLHFQGRVVGDYLNPRRLMFMDTDEHTARRLEDMLKSYVDHQKKAQKKSAS